MTTAIRLEVQDRVARVTLAGENGVQLLSAETRRRLNEVLDQLEQRDDCSVVVFQSQGRTFIAGADISELKSLTAETAEGMASEGQRLMSRIAALGPLTIAAVHAACAGGGCELALACDMRMAAAGARIGLPEVSLGIVPGWGGTVRATRMFGGAVARRMILSGELFAAEEALRLGIVDLVATDETFRSAVDARVAQIVSRGPQAVATAKRLIAQIEGPELESLFQAEARAFAACYASGEPGEGCAAFLDKRPPRWGA